MVNQSRNSFPKPWALQELSNQFHGLQSQGSLEAESLSKSLCGGVFKERIEKGYPLDRDVVPSPIWIKSIGSYQIITIFGSDYSPRKNYLDKIEQNADSTITLWPPT
jgi:CRISPR-associated protein Cmr6